MTITVSSLAHASTFGATTTVTTSSVTPAANCTLVVFVSSWDAGNLDAPLVSSITGLSLTWTQAGHVAAGGTHGDLSAWFAVCGASPGSGALTITTSTNVSAGNCYDILQVTGGPATGNGAAITSNVKTAQITNGTAPTCTMSAALDPGNVFLVGVTAVLVSAQTQAVTPATGWTELNDFYNSSSSTGGVGLETQVSPDAAHTLASGTWVSKKNGMILGLEVGNPAASSMLLMF